jgi:hypothetical protein
MATLSAATIERARRAAKEARPSFAQQAAAAAAEGAKLSFRAAIMQLDVDDAVKQLRTRVLPGAWAQLAAGDGEATAGLRAAASEPGVLAARERRAEALADVESGVHKRFTAEARHEAREFVEAGLDEEDAAAGAAVFDAASVGVGAQRPTPGWVHSALDGIARATPRFPCAAEVATEIAMTFEEWAEQRHPALREVTARTRGGWPGAALAIDAARVMRAALAGKGGVQADQCWARFDALLRGRGNSEEDEGESEAHDAKGSAEWKSTSSALEPVVVVGEAHAAAWDAALVAAWAVEIV